MSAARPLVDARDENRIERLRATLVEMSHRLGFWQLMTPGARPHWKSLDSYEARTAMIKYYAHEMASIRRELAALEVES